MSRIEKLRQQILSGRSDANIHFEDLRTVLLYFEFDERISGSHYLFRKKGIEEKINLQKDGNKAKPYQVRLVRMLMLKHKIGGEYEWTDMK
jgi:hypothetical protein